MTLVIGILQHTVSIRQTIVAEDEELLAVLDYMRLSAEHAGTGSEMKHDSVDVEKITLDEAFSYNQGDNDNYWRLLSSVNYRLTRKRIIDKVLKQLQDLQECLQSIEQAEATNSACTDSAKSYLHEIEKNAEIIRKSTSGLVKLKYQKALLAYLEAIRNPANRPTL